MFRGIQGPNALNGIITSKIVPNFSYNKIDNPQRPHNGQSIYFATEFAGIGGNVKYLKPVTEYKKFLPVNKGRNTVGFRVLGSWISGYGGLVAPPADRFYMGGDTDMRGFDIRAISPVSFFPTVGHRSAAESRWQYGSAEPGQSAPGHVQHHHPGGAGHLPRRRHPASSPTWSTASRSSGRSRWRRSSIPVGTLSRRVRSWPSPPSRCRR